MIICAHTQDCVHMTTAVLQSHDLLQQIIHENLKQIKMRARTGTHLPVPRRMEETRLGLVPVQTAHMGAALLQQPALHPGVSTIVQGENTQVACECGWWWVGEDQC